MRTRVFEGNTYVADYLSPLPLPLRARIRLFAGGTQACADVVLGEHVDLHFRDGAALKALMAWLEERRIPIFLLPVLCHHCGASVPRPEASGHLLRECPHAPAELLELAQAAQNLIAHREAPRGDEACRAAAAHLGHCIAEAEWRKKPAVAEAVVLDAVNGFFDGPGRHDPWFAQVVRDAARAHLRALRKPRA